MQFEKDIFISYAHIDDESLIEGQKGWITEFHRALEIRLAQLSGRRPRIWRDPELTGNHVFDQQIVDQFPKVALMISIISPRYVRSEWCVREVMEFYKTCQENIGFSIQNKARIFKVIKTPVHIDNHPEAIRNLLGYEFYAQDKDTGRVKEFSHVFGQNTDKAYWEKLDDLAHDISTFLDELERYTLNGSGAPSVSALRKQDAKRIYLAESTYDSKEYRDNIRRHLLDNGYEVLPDKQLPLVAHLLQEEINNYLGNTELSIHVLGGGYGIVPEGTQKSIIELQNEVCSSYSTVSNMPRLIWVPEGLHAEDDRQRGFLKKLSDGAEGIACADLVFSSLEDFKNVLTDKLKKLESVQAEPEEEVATETSAGGLVYLICDIQDLDEIRPLEDFLFDQGIEVVIPAFEGDEADIREDHIENLKSCDGVIIFFGIANELWLRSKMRDFLKINGYGRKKPLGFKAVYLAPPASIAKQRFRSLEAEVINGLEQFPEQELRSMLSKI